MTSTEINTWAERAARAAHDSGNQGWVPAQDAYDFVANAARENGETVPAFTAANVRQFKHDYQRHLKVLQTKRPEAWFGEIQELGGYGCFVVADSEANAKAALMKAWRDYDRDYVSDYRGRVKSFDDLAEIYGAHVRLMPWNQYVMEGQ